MKRKIGKIGVICLSLGRFHNLLQAVQDLNVCRCQSGIGVFFACKAIGFINSSNLKNVVRMGARFYLHIRLF